LAQSTAKDAIFPFETSSTGVLTSSPISTGLAIFLGCYLLGLCFLLLRLAIGTYRARRLVRDAVLQDGVRISTSCAVPVTVGFLHPTVILPDHWRQWSPAQLDVILTHEREHARRRDSLVQWLALLNRALFWFHPVAWWLERHLSALAEEACDNVVLARGHDPREYSEYLIDMARSVTRSGARLNTAGMAMPGGSLRRRIRQILTGGEVARISRARMVRVVMACAITCTAFAAGKLDHAQQVSSAQHASTQPASAAQPVTKFMLGDLTIKGDVHDRDRVRDRILKVWKGRESDDGKDLSDDVAAGTRQDFQERGYFKVVIHDPVSQPLGLTDGKQVMLIIASITEGDQFRLKTLTIQNVSSGGALSIPSATLRDQFHVRNGALFNMTEIRTGLERLQQLYISRGYPDFSAEPHTEIDSASHGIDLTVRVTEGQHKP
jgi:BlaR1 peptidase M56/Surface antigen variable number repeat